MPEFAEDDLHRKSHEGIHEGSPYTMLRASNLVALTINRS